MQESIYYFVLERLEAYRGRWPSVAEGSGVSKRTIEKICSREIKDPGVSHIEKLAKYFNEQGRAA